MSATPGPWRVVSWMHQRSAPKIHVESTDAGMGHVRICTLTPKNNGPAIDANAKLIAAAPELVAALLEYWEQAAEPHAIDCDCAACVRFFQARDALAEAGVLASPSGELRAAPLESPAQTKKEG